MEKEQIAQMVDDVEELSKAHRRQGWKQPDFAKALSGMLGQVTRGSVAIFIASHDCVKIGSAEFAVSEASYIRAHAGMAISGGTLAAPVGINDAKGQRWLLSSSSRSTISLKRGDNAYRLRPEQVIASFKGFFGT